MANSNPFKRRIEASSIVTLNDGTTTLTLVAIEPGSIAWEPGGYEPIEWKDRGVLQDPLEGDERPTPVEMKLKYTGSQDVSDVLKFLQARDTTNKEKMKLFTMVVKIPTVKGGTTGEQLTFAKCFLAPGGLKVQGGEKYDTLEVKMIDNEVTPATATY